MFFKTKLFLFFAALAVPSIALQSIDQIKNWVPSYLHEDKELEEIKGYIDAERITSTDKNEGDQRDYGFSFPGVLPIQEECLSDIKNRFEVGKSRPNVLDLGAGHGFMTWKMIIAGGCVSAIELNQPTAQKMQERIKQTRGFLDKDKQEKINQVYQGYVSDVLNSNCNAYQKTYDVTWSGALIHLMTPSQVESYLVHLKKITSPGGTAYVTVNATSGNSLTCDLYEKQKREKKKFPGYMMVDKKIFKYSKEQKNHKVEFLKTHEIKDQNSIPGIAHYGFYENSQKEPGWKVEGQDSLKGTLYSRIEHAAMNFFDPEVLSALFEQAGFTVESVYYINRKGKQANPLLKELQEDHYYVGLKARVPSS